MSVVRHDGAPPVHQAGSGGPPWGTASSPCSPTPGQRAGPRAAERTSEVPVTRTFVVVALLWALPSALVAQTGRITGLTVDSSGQGVGGVTVTATTMTGSSRSAVSTPNGNFVIEPLAPGNYQLRATRQGLPPVTRQVQVGVGSLDVRIVMPIGAAPQPRSLQTQPLLISPDEPAVPLPRDSLKIPVPDSAILNMRQSAGRVAFTPRVGQSTAIPLFTNVTLTVEITQVTETASGSQSVGDIVESGRRVGMATIVVRGDHVVVNIRRGLKLYQIRPQARGIHLIVEVDQTKIPSRGDDASHGGAQ